MASSLENVKLGPCSVTFDSVDLGYTKGGVEVEVSTETYEVKVDQFGETVISDLIIGRNITVTTPFAETTVDNMVAIMPGATKIIDGTTSTKIKAEVKTAVGTNLIESAGELVLHPIGVTGVGEDLTIPQAATPGQMSFAYRSNEERVFNCTWKGYPNSVTGLLFIFGDETATA